MAITIVRDQTALMRHEVRIGPYSFGADVSADEGGQGLGPNPHDLYDAALGACEALTVLWYANRKGIPVDNIEITVERDQSEEKAGVYRLDSKLKLGGNFSDAQRAEFSKLFESYVKHPSLANGQKIAERLQGVSEAATAFFTAITFSAVPKGMPFGRWPSLSLHFAWRWRILQLPAHNHVR